MDLTAIGITTGYFAGAVGGTTKEMVDLTTVSVACTQYIVQLENSEHLPLITIGDRVKLPGHNTAPSFAAGLVKGDSSPTKLDENGVGITSDIGLRVDEKISLNRIVLSGFRVDAQSHGSNDTPGDYISIRRIFTIAKGRVGVT